MTRNGYNQYDIALDASFPTLWSLANLSPTLLSQV